jgi:anti-anti-sigma regulatory factor
MLKTVCTDQVEEVVIDLSQVAFLDSAALGLLMISHRQLEAERRKLSWPILSRRFARSSNWRICTRRSR